MVGEIRVVVEGVGGGSWWRNKNGNERELGELRELRELEK